MIAEYSFYYLLTMFADGVMDIWGHGGFGSTPPEKLAKAWAYEHHYLNDTIVCTGVTNVHSVLNPCVIVAHVDHRKTKTIYCPNTQLKVDGERITECREFLDSDTTYHKPMSR